MKENKRYYWLKLKEDFFDEKYIKALRKLPDGDALCIVYLKMQLKSLKTEGIIQYDHILPSAEEELALALDEDVNIVRLALNAIINMGLVEKWENDTFYMAAMQDLIGSETAVASRVRRHRERQKMLQCNTDVTLCNTDIDIENRDKSIDIEKEIIKEKTTRFKKPTLEEVEAYCQERKNGINANNFIDYYESIGWKVGRNPMKDWKAAIRTWEKNGKEINNDKNRTISRTRAKRDGSEYAMYD